MRAIGLVMAAGILTTAGCGMSKAQADRLLAEQAKVAGEAVMSSLGEVLVNPQEVRWGAVWENSGRICGSFSPKDRAGAYLPFRRFVGQRGGSVLIEEMSGADFSVSWGAFCNHAHHLVKAGEPAGPPIHPMTDEERAAEQAAFDARPGKPRGGRAFDI